jgi:hypothetical protein
MKKLLLLLIVLITFETAYSIAAPVMQLKTLNLNGYPVAKRTRLIISSLAFKIAQMQPDADQSESDSASHSLIHNPIIQHTIWFILGCIFTLVMELIFGKRKRRRHSNGRNNSTRIPLPPSIVNANIQEPNWNVNNMNNGGGRTVDSRIQDQSRGLEKELDDEPKESNTVEFENINNILPEPKPQAISQILYFPNPNQDGDFRKDNGSDTYIDGASIYKFVVNENEAQFEFCSQRSSVSIALNNRNELILSVAEELNAYNASAVQIISEGPQKGVAILDGLFWKVKSKAKIKYT